jgi:hypothetical protein
MAKMFMKAEFNEVTKLIISPRKYDGEIDNNRV